MRFFLLISIFFVNLLTVNTSVAAECTEQKIYACSQEELCEAATITILGQSYWRTGLSFVDLAKARGWDCGTSTDTTKLEKNSSTQMLQLDADRGVTKDGSNNEIDNQESALDRYNRTGVWTQSPTPPSFRSGHCDAESPTNCTRDQLCKAATEIIDGKIVWKNGRSQEFVSEALRRRITCGVLKNSKNSVQYGSSISCDLNSLGSCETSKLCVLATYTSNGTKLWKTLPKVKAFAEEARKRGLTCGVVPVKRTPKPQQKKTINSVDRELYRCKTNPRICSERELCERAKSSPKHQAELQQRRLDCPADVNEVNKQNVLRYLNGSWSGTINCSNKIFPFVGNINTSKSQKSIELITQNYTYTGDFTLNKFSNRIFVNAKRSDGDQFNETFTYSRARNSFEGRTSAGCYLLASKGNSNAVLLSFGRDDFNELNSTQRKQFQYALKQLGYYKSSVDGLYGPKTENAARAYAQAKGIKNGYPDSLYRRLVSEVNVPSSFAIAKQPQKPRSRPTQSGTNSNSGQAIAKGIFAIIACQAAPNPSACLSGVAGNKPNTSIGQSVDVFSNDNSCSRDGNCGYNEICVKKPGMTRGLCMGKPSGVGRNWSPQSCTRDTQCMVGARCDRTYRICVER